MTRIVNSLGKLREKVQFQNLCWLEMQSYSKNIYIFLYLHVALLNGGNVGKKIINNSNAPPTGDDVCANYHWFFTAEVCY